MSNMLKIAGKEFSDLLSNSMIHIVLATFFVYIFVSLYQLNRGISNPQTMFIYNNDIGIAASQNLFHVFMEYGGFLGVMIGYQAIAKDFYNNAINTLIVKPVYRDTIINGKLISIAAFVLFVMAIVATFNTAALLILLGDRFASSLNSYLALLPITFIVPLLFVMIFVSISMLISLVISSRALGLTLSLMAVFISSLIESGNFAGVISFMFPGNQNYVENFIVGLSPHGILLQIMNHAYIYLRAAPIVSIMDIQSDIVKLIFFIVMPVIIGYIVFLRKDVS